MGERRAFSCLALRAKALIPRPACEHQPPIPATFVYKILLKLTYSDAFPETHSQSRKYGRPYAGNTWPSKNDMLTMMARPMIGYGVTYPPFDSNRCQQLVTRWRPSRVVVPLKGKLRLAIRADLRRLLVSSNKCIDLLRRLLPPFRLEAHFRRTFLQAPHPLVSCPLKSPSLPMSSRSITLRVWRSSPTFATYQLYTSLRHLTAAILLSSICRHGLSGTFRCSNVQVVL